MNTIMLPGPMGTPLRVACVALLAALAACSRPAEVAAPSGPSASAAAAPADPQPVAGDAARATGIAWQYATNDGEVDAAFAQAKAANQPVFVYWGATWCPPCNHVKSTLFNRQDFIERSRAFVPVYIDGDSPGAQKLGARFKVRGYPTMVLFSPAGEEVTRLPGEVDPQLYTEVLTLGMNAQRPVKAVLADARAGGKGLSPNDWKLLAFFSWETDEQAQLLPPAQVPAVLKELSAACPKEQVHTCTRLFLKATAAGASSADNSGARERLLEVLRNAEPSRVQMDVLSYQSVELVRALSATKTPERQQLVEAYDASLAGLAHDVTLSRADRLSAQIARAKLANIEAAKDAKPQVPPALLTEVREQVAQLDRETTDRYEREAVITTAADLLEACGAADESDALLKANLDKSHAPYYLMLGLANNARQRGDTAEALRWYQQAYDQSVGPATRLQWGGVYVRALLELAPKDEARIEQATVQLFNEAAAQPDAFYERNARSLQRVGEKLRAWEKGHGASMKRMQAQLKASCAKVPEAQAQRSTCLAVLKPARA